MEELPRIVSNDFFKRPANIVGKDLIGCNLFKKTASGKIIHGVIVETEAYSQNEAACHGFKSKTKKNATLFGESGCLYVYLSYGVHHCINIVTGEKDWASGVLLRALAIPNENERTASGPGLISKKFEITCIDNGIKLSMNNGVWISKENMQPFFGNIINTTRIGISKAKDLPLRWYLQSSRSVSKRAKGDRRPSITNAWKPSAYENFQ